MQKEKQNSPIHSRKPQVLLRTNKHPPRHLRMRLIQHHHRRHRHARLPHRISQGSFLAASRRRSRGLSAERRRLGCHPVRIIELDPIPKIRRSLSIVLLYPASLNRRKITGLHGFANRKLDDEKAGCADKKARRPRDQHASTRRGSRLQCGSTTQRRPGDERVCVGMGRA